MVVRAINWGAYVQSVIVPDRDGSFEDVVIGYDNWDEYYNDCCYSGPVLNTMLRATTVGPIMM